MPTIRTGDGGQIAYARIGSGDQPLLLLHDWPYSGAVWQDFVEALPQEKFTVCMPDQRGSGFSFQPASGYTLDRYAEDMVALVSHESEHFEKKWVVVGHGMGGAIAQRLAILYGRKMAALVLVAPIPLSGLTLSGELGEILQKAASDPQALEEALPKLFGGALDDDTRDLLLDDADATAPACVKESFAAWTQGGPAEKLSRVRVPVLIIAGGKDPLLSEELLRKEIAEPLKQAEVRVLPGLGHYIPLEDAPELAARIEQFVASLQQ